MNDLKQIQQTYRDRVSYSELLKVRSRRGRRSRASGEPLPLRAGMGAQIKAVRPRSDYRQVSRRGFPDLGTRTGRTSF